MSDGALILFDIVLIPVDGSCQVVVSSIVDPECHTPIPVTTGLMTEELAAIVGGAIGGVIVLVVAVIIVIIIICLVCTKRTRVFAAKNTR